MPELDSNQEPEFRQLTGPRRGSADISLLKRRVVARGKALRAAYLRGLWWRIVSWYQTRAAVAELQSLDDVALKDIGLHRSGIEAAVIDGMAPAEVEQRQISGERPKSQVSLVPPKRRTFPEKPHLWLQRTG